MPCSLRILLGVHRNYKCLQCIASRVDTLRSINAQLTRVRAARQRFTEVSIVVLLVGTLVGGFMQTGEIFSTGALSYAPDGVPGWVQARSGSFLMVLAVCFIVFPASLVEVMTQVRPYLAQHTPTWAPGVHEHSRARHAMRCSSMHCLSGNAPWSPAWLLQADEPGWLERLALWVHSGLTPRGMVCSWSTSAWWALSSCSS